MKRITIQILPWAIIAGVTSLVIFGLAITSRTNAQPVQTECHAAIILDRSASVGWFNLGTMREQIRQLFLPTVGLYSDLTKLAFWSFSATTNRTSNYNAPYHGFVSSRGVNSSFQQALAQLTPSGATNYEQGFAYDRGIPNTYGNMGQIVNQADIIVFMTDGIPNSPGIGNNNSLAKAAGRAAALRHKANGKVVVGGIIEGMDRKSLNFVINGNNNNAANTFQFDDDYEDLAEELKRIITEKCSDLLPPDPPDPVRYSLTPRVSARDPVASGTGNVTFDYRVDNSANDSTRMTKWSIKRVLVAPSEPANPLYYNNYRDNYSCPEVVALVNGKASCTEVRSGSRIFGPNVNDMTPYIGGAGSVAIDDNWQIGTKLCFILTLEFPTHNNSPRDRYSRADCTTIGKYPKVQVHGGDLRVGRSFEGENTNRADVTGTLTVKSNGRTYGSWAEYGVLTSGVVTGFASNSGLAGGYPSAQPNTQEFWSKLTFANTNNQYGQLTPFPNTLGNIPDAISALTKGRSITENLNGNIHAFNGLMTNGLYQKSSGNLELRTSNIAKTRSYVLYVPNDNVTITGNITAADGPYNKPNPEDNIKDIPQLVIIARNIYIADTVDNVDAWLIARGNSSQGIINTCNVAGNLSIGICNDRLRINGPVMAQSLVLRRTAGAGAGGAAGDPAEILNLPANTYLWSHSEGRSDLRIQTTYSIELPPYF